MSPAIKIGSFLGADVAGAVAAALISRAVLTWEVSADADQLIPRPIPISTPRGEAFVFPNGTEGDAALSEAYATFAKLLRAEIDADGLSQFVEQGFARDCEMSNRAADVAAPSIGWATVLGNNNETRDIPSRFFGRLAPLGGVVASTVLKGLGWVEGAAFSSDDATLHFEWDYRDDPPRRFTVRSYHLKRLDSVFCVPKYKAAHPIVEAAGLQAGVDISAEASGKPVVFLDGDGVFLCPRLGTIFVAGLRLALPDGETVPIRRVLPAFRMEGKASSAFARHIAQAMERDGEDAGLLIVPVASNDLPVILGTIRRNPEYITWLVLAMQETEEWPIDWREYVLGTTPASKFDEASFREELARIVATTTAQPLSGSQPPSPSAYETPDTSLAMKPEVAIRVVGARLRTLALGWLDSLPVPPPGIAEPPSLWDPQTWLQASPLTPFVRWLSNQWLPHVAGWCNRTVMGGVSTSYDLGGIEFWTDERQSIANGLASKLAAVRERIARLISEERQLLETLVPGVDAAAAEVIARDAIMERAWLRTWHVALERTPIAETRQSIQLTAAEAAVLAAYRIGRCRDALTPIHQVVLDFASDLIERHGTDCDLARAEAAEFVRAGRLLSSNATSSARLLASRAIWSLLDDETRASLIPTVSTRAWTERDPTAFEEPESLPIPASDDITRRTWSEQRKTVLERVERGEVVFLREVVPYLTADEALEHICQRTGVYGAALAPQWAELLRPEAISDEVITALLAEGSRVARELLSRRDLPPSIRRPIFEWCLAHYDGTERAVNHRVQGVVDEAFVKLLQIGVPGPAASWRERVMRANYVDFDRRSVSLASLLLSIVGLTENDLIVAVKTHSGRWPLPEADIRSHPACTAAVVEVIEAVRAEPALQN